MTLFIVGDVDQLLFRFAGAKPEILTEELDKAIPNIQTHFLSTNYRSTQEIINKCSALIANNYSDKGGEYDQKFMKATQPRPDAPVGTPISFQMFDDTRSEAEGVAGIILEQLANGYEFGDFFVSSRTRAQLGYLEGTLYRNHIKFVNITGGSFWDSYHVRNIVAYLELAFDTNNTEAFEQIYNIASASFTDRRGNYCNHRWMGQEFLRLTDSQFGLMHKAIQTNRRYTDGVIDFQNFVQEIQAEISYAPTAAEPINFIVNNCYRQWLKAKGEVMEEDVDSSIDDDIATILDVAGQYSKIEDFLVYVSDMRKAAAEAKNGNMDEYVVLSTIHRLKGSERKIMLGIGWCEGVKKVGLQELPVGLLPHTFSLTPPPQFGVLPTSGMGRIDDERCCAFVCVSRAKEQVFLTAPRVYRDAIMRPSRFVTELGLTVDVSEISVPVVEDVNFQDNF